MLFSKILVWFAMFSFMGWIFETIYCTVKEKKWQNRGFLYGPILPIYGVGAVAIGLVADYASLKAAAELTWWQIFLISYFGSIVLEYSTSWFLEKRFGALWWDYSDRPLNIHGRICFECSCGFGLAGILVVKVLYPRVQMTTLPIAPLWMELISLVLMAIIAGDLALTVSALTNFQRQLQAAEDLLDHHMEEFVDGITRRTDATASRIHETTDATAALLAEMKAETVALIEQEREKFSLENLERMTLHMSHSRKAAISRVKRFTVSHMPENHSLHINTVLNYIKNFRK